MSCGESVENGDYKTGNAYRLTNSDAIEAQDCQVKKRQSQACPLDGVACVGVKSFDENEHTVQKPHG